MISLGGGKSSSSNKSYVWDDQTPFLTNLYEQGQSLYDQGAPGVQEYSTDFVNKNAPHLQDVTNKLGDVGFTQGIKEGTNLGMGSMSNFMSPQGNPYLEQNINYAMGDIGRNLRENILTGNASEAGLNNSFGGSRHSLSDAAAKEEALRLGGQVSSQMRTQAYDSDQARALDAAKSYTGAGMTADQIEAQKLGMIPGAVDASYNLGMSPHMAPYDLLDRYSATVGGPTVLGEGSSSGWNVSGSFGPK